LRDHCDKESLDRHEFRGFGCAHASEKGATESDEKDDASAPAEGKQNFLNAVIADRKRLLRHTVAGPGIFGAPIRSHA